MTFTCHAFPIFPLTLRRACCSFPNFPVALRDASRARTQMHRMSNHSALHLFRDVIKEQDDDSIDPETFCSVMQRSHLDRPEHLNQVGLDSWHQEDRHNMIDYVYHVFLIHQQCRKRLRTLLHIHIIRFERVSSLGTDDQIASRCGRYGICRALH